MARADRLKLIEEIEENRDSKLISYVTGDRPGLITRISDDAVRLIHSHLDQIGQQERIDLFLYTRGGVLMAPLRLVQLTREYCQKFKVLVPFRAHSAGTLICLGADGILMGKLGELTPVDPTTANDFNPQNPLNPAARIPISVEDVNAYLNLAKEQAQLTSESTRLEVFKALTNQINPIALGNVRRVYNAIRLVTDELLRLQMVSEEEKAKIPEIVRMLAETYPHDYLIPRSVAQRIGLKAERPDHQLESLMTDLYKTYENDLSLQDPFNPDALLGAGGKSSSFSHETAYMESTSMTQAFIQAGVVQRQSAPIQVPGAAGVPTQIGGLEQIIVKFNKQKWEVIK